MNIITILVISHFNSLFLTPHVNVIPNVDIKSMIKQSTISPLKIELPQIKVDTIEQLIKSQRIFDKQQ